MAEQTSCPGRVPGAAAMAYPRIPVQRDTAEVAAYLLVYLLAPLVGANLLLAADVLHDIAVVWYAVIVELDEEAAWKV